MEGLNQKKLFISHSSRDLAYVSHLVKYLGALGMNENNMFCSSIKGYGIPLGENIYDYLKEQFQNYELRVIFVLSDNYYNSVASLNEMGAAWVLQNDYNCILLPKFEFKDIKGAVDPRKISIKMDSSEKDVKNRLFELWKSLQKDFKLRDISYVLFDNYSAEFIRNVRNIASLWEDLHRCATLKKTKSEWLIPLQKLEVLDPESFDVLFSLSITYGELGDIGQARYYLKKAEDVASDEDMRKDIQKFKIKMKL